MRRTAPLAAAGLSAALLLSGLSACGGGDSATVVLSGRKYQLAMTGVDCYAGPPTGATPGFDGIMAAGVVCTLNFRTTNFFSDILAINVSDVRPIYETRGIPQVVGGGLIDVYLTLQGVPQAIYGGYVRFTEISNVSGNRVCASYELATADAQIKGHFCDDVAGY